MTERAPTTVAEVNARLAGVAPVLWNVITGNPEIPVLLVWATDKQDARFKAGVKMGTGYYSNFRCIEA